MRFFSRFLKVVVLLLPSYGEATSTTLDPYRMINNNWERFGAVYSRVMSNYYKDVDHSELMRAAIEGLLRELDSYSQFFDEEGVRQLRQDTTGRFAGLGITVGIKDNYPVVIAPMDGTPAKRAGLQPGDLIVAIEGADSFELSLEEVVTSLRGEPGSMVNVTISRAGNPSWDVTITRELITIKSVALAYLITSHIGYISMRETRFSEGTAVEVEQALAELKSQGMEAAVFDLRGNPGGLLSQAAQVADLFLSPQDPIVSIRERDGGREETRYSQRKPVFEERPLIVLIDGGSASAAEIVAGAIQDNDRGLVVGTTSFGKGSVQTIFDLHEEEDAALKLTTALYFTPSGRSIHRSYEQHSTLRTLNTPLSHREIPAALLLGVILSADDRSGAMADLRSRFNLKHEEAKQLLQVTFGDLVGLSVTSTMASEANVDDGKSKSYQTRNGRRVFGGGGITPDIMVEPEKLPQIVQQLQRRRLFFDFIVDYVSVHALDSTDQADVDHRMVSAFHDFVPDSMLTVGDGRSKLSEFSHLARNSAWGSSARPSLDSLEKILNAHTSGQRFTPQVERFVRSNLQRELALRLHGHRASLLTKLTDDIQLEEAINLIKDKKRFKKLLNVR